MDLDSVIIYHGGQFKAYGDARVGLLTHGLNYGTGCFEGIRGYWSAADNQLFFFRLAEHYDRMRSSAKLLKLALPEDTEALCRHTVELARRNDYRQDVYVRPIAFKSSEEIGVRLHNVKGDFAIVAVPHKSYFDASKGLKVGVASWRRIDDNSAPARAKLTGVYVSSALAKTEAVENGFDEAILLSSDGHVSEGSAENLFMVRGGRVITPPVTDSILEGITRDTLIELCRNELNIEVVERSIDRSELYAAEELFFSGTAVGVGPVIEVDRRQVGDGTIGPISTALGDLYAKVSLGKLARYRQWVTPCFPSLVAGAV